jgi:hypothetical protein
MLEGREGRMSIDALRHSNLAFRNFIPAISLHRVVGDYVVLIVRELIVDRASLIGITHESTRITVHPTWNIILPHSENTHNIHKTSKHNGHREFQDERCVSPARDRSSTYNQSSMNPSNRSLPPPIHLTPLVSSEMGTAGARTRIPENTLSEP